MSLVCKRNAGAEIRILAQRTVVRVGKGGAPIGDKDRERLVGHKERKGCLCRWRHMLILRLICLKGW
jgi:hypothetical protein